MVHTIPRGHSVRIVIIALALMCLAVSSLRLIVSRNFPGTLSRPKAPPSSSDLFRDSKIEKRTTSGSVQISAVTTGMDQPTSRRVGEAFGKLPLHFEANKGQTDARVKFISRGRGYGLFLTSTEAVLALSKPAQTQSHRVAAAAPASSSLPAPCNQEVHSSSAAVVGMKLVGANRVMRPTGYDKLSGEINYFIGNDPSKWRTDVTTYASVKYSGVYRGVDLVYHGDQGQLEYDFRLARGVSLQKIKLAFTGADKLEVDQSGDLVLHIGTEEARQHQPVAYQEAGGVRKEFASRYVLRGKQEIGFEVDGYDRSQPLIIDPVLSYSTFLGGNNDDYARGIAVDNSGNAYITGTTSSANFPTLNPLSGQGTYHDAGFSDAFVSKINAAGTALVYSTFLGGNFDDSANAIAVDGSNNVYITGRTDATTFPTVNAIQSSLTLNSGGYICHFNAFVTKINSAGNALVYSTYLGGSGAGSGGDSGSAIGFDLLGNTYVSGSTYSADFPTANAVQPNLAGTFLFRSSDGGSNWGGSETGLPKRPILGITIDPKTPSTLFVNLADGGVWKSTNGGDTWTRSDTGISTGGDISEIVVDPINDSNVYAAGGNRASGCFYDPGVYKSTNGGSTWTASSNGLTNHAIRALAIDPKVPTTLYVGTDGKSFSNSPPTDSAVLIFKSTDGGATWSPSETGIFHAQLIPNVIDTIVIDPVNTSNVYAGSVQLGLGALYKSTNGGANWTYLSGLSGGTSVLAIDPSNPSTLYAEKSGVYKSTDGGTTWTLTGTTGLATSSISSIIIDPTTTSTIYVGTSAGIYKSSNSGATWTALTIAGNNLPAITNMAMTPSGTSRIYAALLRQSDGFVAKLNSAGNALSYSTFLGGNDSDVVNGMAVDGMGNAYLTGTTSSLNFPTNAALQASMAAGTCGFTGLMSACNDAFVTKIAATGASLSYSTYLGGNNNDNGNAIAIDNSGNAYVTGSTASTNFPTLNAFQSSLNSGSFASNDAFVTKINSSGSGLVFSTYFGGTSGDSGNGIAVDSLGNVTITGATSSTDFPLLKSLNCYRGGGDAFVTRFNSSGSTLSYSTYLGGTNTETGHAVALDPNGNSYVTGETRSSNFKTVNPVQGTFGGGNCSSFSTFPCRDAFLSKIALQGTSGSDVVTTKCASPDPMIQAGNNLTYSLYVTNSGPQTATAVTVSDILPAGVNFVSVNTTKGSCSGTSTINCSLGDINNDGTATITIVVTPTQGGTITNTGSTSSTSADPNSSNNSSSAVTQVTPTPTPTPTPTSTPTPTPTPNVVQFSSSNYSVTEACTTVTITVNRIGNTSGAVSVDYNTSDVTATERGDYITALGTLRFAAGETSKSFVVLINDDSYVEGTETFNVNLSNPSGVGLGAPSVATVTINDNPTEPPTNVIDNSQNYVCQHYHDFLNRQPDQSGWDFWTNEISSCGTDQACIQLKRITVSGAYFLSIEFQQTGYLVERMYKVAYGDASAASTFGGAHQLAVPIVRFKEFLRDTQQIGLGVVVLQPGWEQLLENNKQAFAADFVQRSRFTTALPTTLTPAQFVDKLNQNAGNVLSASDRTTAINLFGSATNTSNVTARAQALRQIAENQNLYNAEFNRAFVLMQYFGYLRRNPNDPQDPDYTGWEFWLAKLNQFNGNFVNAEMVKAFIVSVEYRSRFGP